MAGVEESALDILFRVARTRWQYTDEPVTDEDLQQIYGLLELGPTSANSSPARFVFVRTAEGKERLKPALSSGNLDKTMKAPVTVIVAYDPGFYNNLPRLFPGVDAKTWFAGNPELSEETAFRNGTLQGAYLILAARALGIDGGAMSGFDRGKVDRAFFSTTGWKSNFLVNLGHGAPDEKIGERLPKLKFEEAALFA